MSSLWIAGAGAFGCALARLFCTQGEQVHLYGRSIATGNSNTTRLPSQVALETELNPGENDLLLVALPTQAVSEFFFGSKLKPTVAIACCKGIDLRTGRLPTQILGDTLGCETAVLTGPSFAADMSAGLPTALTLASNTSKLADGLQARLSGPLLRLYSTEDAIGAQLGGALKNVIAIACGATVGAGFGESARAALLTRGYAEMVRLAEAMGAQRETLSGLSGLGDLALSSMSEKSRNFSFGLALGQDKAPANVTTEGRATARAVMQLARKHNVAMPIAETVAAISEGQMSVESAMKSLMSRPLTTE